MQSPRHLLAAATYMWLCLASLYGQQIVASGVDAAGKRHLGSLEFPGLDEPWIRDRIAYTPPEYPYHDRLVNNQGDGLFRISIDLKSGLVTQVTVVRSTRFPSLDSSAMAAIRKWRWRPGKWKEVDIPIRFTMRRR